MLSSIRPAEERGGGVRRKSWRVLRAADRLKRRYPFGAALLLCCCFGLVFFGVFQIRQSSAEPKASLLAAPVRGAKELQALQAASLELKPLTAPTDLSTTTAKGGWGGPRPINAREQSELRWNYLLNDKNVKYVGHDYWRRHAVQFSRAYYNSLAVFPGYDETHMHGQVGVAPNGTALWQTKDLPPPIDKFPGGRDAALKNGGFYLPLSDALPLDRDIPDNRDPVCHSVEYNRTDIGDASILITFYNEPLSTLLRTVHSVLNLTPAPMLREIILIDDHSDFVDNLPGGPLDEYVRHLPKVKLLRMHERRGIVHARIAGAKAAQGSALVVLDSHIEVNPGWLEPQLARVKESPESIVFPQILGIAADTMEHRSTTGIGCNLSFRWVVVEQAALTGKVDKPDVIPSPSMAGGLFTVDRQFFWDIGGYDEEFIAWGAENVEMALRTWMCGGRVECAPCAKTYHIYRKGGSGYANPMGALWRNRKRTARLWMDEYYQISEKLIDVSASHASYDTNLGSFDTMLDLKERLHCKNFKWYLENIEPTHDLQTLDDVIALGRLRNGDTCIDLGGQRTAGSKVSSYACHSKKKMSANQGFLMTRDDKRIRLMANDKRCLSMTDGTMFVQQCTDAKSPHWRVEEVSEANFDNSVDPYVELRLVWTGGAKELCLSLNGKKFALLKCDALDMSQSWRGDVFVPDPNFQLPEFSYRKKLRRQHWEV